LAVFSGLFLTLVVCYGLGMWQPPEWYPRPLPVMIAVALPIPLLVAFIGLVLSRGAG
jgi:hypothetical protein